MSGRGVNPSGRPRPAYRGRGFGSRGSRATTTYRGNRTFQFQRGIRTDHVIRRRPPYYEEDEGFHGNSTPSPGQDRRDLSSGDVKCCGNRNPCRCGSRSAPPSLMALHPGHSSPERGMQQKQRRIDYTGHQYSARGAQQKRRVNDPAVRPPQLELDCDTSPAAVTWGPLSPNSYISSYTPPAVPSQQWLPDHMLLSPRLLAPTGCSSVRPRFPITPVSQEARTFSGAVRPSSRPLLGNMSSSTTRCTSPLLRPVTTGVKSPEPCPSPASPACRTPTPPPCRSPTSPLPDLVPAEPRIHNTSLANILDSYMDNSVEEDSDILDGIPGAGDSFIKGCGDLTLITPQKEKVCREQPESTKSRVMRNSPEKSVELVQAGGDVQLPILENIALPGVEVVQMPPLEDIPLPESPARNGGLSGLDEGVSARHESEDDKAPSDKATEDYCRELEEGEITSDSDIDTSDCDESTNRWSFIGPRLPKNHPDSDKACHARVKLQALAPQAPCSEHVGAKDTVMPSTDTAHGSLRTPTTKASMSLVPRCLIIREPSGVDDLNPGDLSPNISDIDAYEAAVTAKLCKPAKSEAKTETRNSETQAPSSIQEKRPSIEQMGVASILKRIRSTSNTNDWSITRSTPTPPPRIAARTSPVTWSATPASRSRDTKAGKENTHGGNWSGSEDGDKRTQRLSRIGPSPVVSSTPKSSSEVDWFDGVPDNWEVRSKTAQGGTHTRFGQAAAATVNRLSSTPAGDSSIGSLRPYQYQVDSGNKVTYSYDTPSPDTLENISWNWKAWFQRRYANLSIGYIDTHCHLDFLFHRSNFKGTFQQYKEENADTIPRAFSGCVAVFCDPRSFGVDGLWKSLVEESGVWGAVGCHPKCINDYGESREQAMRVMLKHPKVIALGEIGLDYSGQFYEHAERQKQIFKRQLEIALEVGKPLVIHCRDAEEDCIEVMEKVVPRNYRIHRHCFTGNWTEARVWLSKFPNSFIGLTPVVTFRNYRGHGPREVASMMPLDRLLLETDAPYFVPWKIPRSGMVYSHPGMAVTVAAEVAHLRGVTLTQVLEACRENTYNMYGV